MIDIRARVNSGNTFTIHHGAVYQNANFDDVLAKLADFLAAHPARPSCCGSSRSAPASSAPAPTPPGQSSFPDIFDAYVRSARCSGHRR